MRTKQHVQEEYIDLKEQLPIIEGYTIDPEDAHELDDGFAVEFDRERNIYHVTIAIADPTGLIEPNSDHADTAIRRVATNYASRPIKQLLAGIIPISSASLNGNELKKVLAVSFDICGATGNKVPESLKVFNALFRSRSNLSYAEANAILHTPVCVDEEHQQIIYASRVVRLLRGYDVIPRHGYSTSERLISILMIEANSVLAQFARDNGIPFVYRNFPVARTVEQLLQDEFLSNVGPEFDLLKKIVMYKCAYYSTNPRVHRGIKTDCYSHLTSPLRRAADLINLWNLNEYMRARDSESHAVYPFEGDRLNMYVEYINSSTLIRIADEQQAKISRDRRVTLDYSYGCEEVLQQMPSRLEKVIDMYLELGIVPPAGYLYQYARFIKQGAIFHGKIWILLKSIDRLTPSIEARRKIQKIFDVGYLVSSISETAIHRLLMKEMLIEECMVHPVRSLFNSCILVSGRNYQFLHERHGIQIVDPEIPDEKIAQLILAPSFSNLNRFLLLNIFHYDLIDGREFDVFIISDSNRFAKRIAQAIIYGILTGEVPNHLQGKVVVIERPSCGQNNPSTLRVCHGRGSRNGRSNGSLSTY